MLRLPLSRERLVEIWRYYQAGVVNTAFGYLAFAILLWLGLNRYAAQAVAHFLGMAFNYLTYSRHVFRGAAPARLRFAASYVANYIMSLAALAALSRFISNAYVAGLTSIVIVSALNYFVLKHVVFKVKSS